MMDGAGIGAETGQLPFNEFISQGVYCRLAGDFPR